MEWRTTLLSLSHLREIHGSRSLLRRAPPKYSKCQGRLITLLEREDLVRSSRVLYRRKPLSWSSRVVEDRERNPKGDFDEDDLSSQKTDFSSTIVELEGLPMDGQRQHGQDAITDWPGYEMSLFRTKTELRPCVTVHRRLDREETQTPNKHLHIVGDSNVSGVLD